MGPVNLNSIQAVQKVDLLVHGLIFFIPITNVYLSLNDLNNFMGELQFYYSRSAQ